MNIRTFVTILSALLLTQLCESFFKTINVIFFAVLFLTRAFLRSMAPALDMVKKMILKLIESRSKIPTWVLTSFNDPKVELVKKTNDVKELRSALNQLRYGGGRDMPEQAFEGATYLEYNLKIYVGNINLKYLPFP